MAIPFYSTRRLGDQLTAAADAAEEAGAHSVQEAEGCVRQHPESAVWTAFGAGLLLGAAIVWVTMEAHQQTWQGKLEALAERLRRKAGID